jgi:uracil-DNA glycosylase
LLADEFAQPYWAGLVAFVEKERSLLPVYPPANQVFRALELTSCARTKVVIIGQDPYHGPGQAQGLCLSVPYGVDPPPSLVNIHRELQADVGINRPNHGSLDAWADQGVLLLNTILTVRAGEPGSHRGRGWERFTDAVIRVVTAESEPVFLLWGREAHRKEGLIRRTTRRSNRIVKSSHPSPPAAYGSCAGSPPFIGSRPFSTANRLLRQSGRDEIEWDLTP